MGKTIYSQVDEVTLYNYEPQYYSADQLGLIDGLSKDDIAEGFPISFEATFSGKTIVKNLTCVSVRPIYSGDAILFVRGVFGDAPEVSSANVSMSLLLQDSGQVLFETVSILKDYAESVFGQPSSEVVDDETTYCYEQVKIVISSVEEDPFAKFAKNYSDKDAPEVKAPMFDELKKYLIAKHEISEETAKTVFANCYSVVDLLNAICDRAEQGESQQTPPGGES